MPCVSVIIPTYNSACYIRATVESVLQQTFTDFEIIISDDASTDDTLSLVRDVDARIRVHARENNSKTADIPRYEAVEMAEGKYCALLDSDDLWRPEKLAKQVAFLDEHPDVNLCHCYTMVIDEGRNELYVRHEGSIPETGIITGKLLRHCFISTSTVVVRRAAWLKAQRREDITGYGTEWDFFLSIARESPVGFIPEVLADYRLVGESTSHGKWKRAPRDVAAKERILGKKLWNGVIPRREMIDIIVDACLENSQYWRGRGYGGRGAYFALDALKRRPFDGDSWANLGKSILKPLVGRVSSEHRTSNIKHPTSK